MRITYTIHSEYTNTIVGKIYNNNGIYTCELLCPEERYDFPITLFGTHREWERDDQATIIRWLESRVIPKDRQFLDEILRLHGLDHWDLETLLKLNQGRTVNDKFYLEIEEDYSDEKQV